MAITDLPTALTTIQSQLGDQDANTLNNLIPVFWNARADKAAIIDGLQFEYALRDCTDVLLGQVWNQVDTTHGDEKEALSDKLKGLQAIRKNCDGEIETLELRATANRSAAIGTLTTTSPRAPWPNPNQPGPWPYPSPNDPGYRGDPLRSKGTPSDVNF